MALNGYKSKFQNYPVKAVGADFLIFPSQLTDRFLLFETFRAYLNGFPGAPEVLKPQSEAAGWRFRGNGIRTEGPVGLMSALVEQRTQVGEENLGEKRNISA